MYGIPCVVLVRALLGLGEVVVRLGKWDVVDGAPVEQHTAGSDVDFLNKRISIPPVRRPADGREVTLSTSEN